MQSYTLFPNPIQLFFRNNIAPPKTTIFGCKGTVLLQSKMV